MRACAVAMRAGRTSISAAGVPRRPAESFLPLVLVLRRLPGRLGLRPEGAAVLFLDAGVDLFTMNLHLGRRFNAELHLSRTNFQDRDLHRVADTDVFS